MLSDAMDKLDTMKKIVEELLSGVSGQSTAKLFALRGLIMEAKDDLNDQVLEDKEERP